MTARPREESFKQVETVSVRNFTEDNWMPGVIEKASGALSYQVKLKDGRIIRRHVDHILACQETETNNSVETDDWINLPDAPIPHIPNVSLQPPLRCSARVSIPPKRYGQVNT